MTLLNEAAPRNFSFMNKCQTGKKGGGIAAIFKSVFQCKEITFGDFSSFEYPCFLVKGDPKVLQDTLENSLMSLPNCCHLSFLIMTGDFNIYVDNDMDSNAKELSSLLDTFGLWQHGKGPTHTQGNSLDLVISKDVDISSVDVKDLALSDHFCVFFDLHITPNVQLTTVSVKKKYINKNASAQFTEIIAMSPIVSAERVDRKDHGGTL